MAFRMFGRLWRVLLMAILVVVPVDAFGQFPPLRDIVMTEAEKDTLACTMATSDRYTVGYADYFRFVQIFGRSVSDCGAISPLACNNSLKICRRVLANERRVTSVLQTSVSECTQDRLECQERLNDAGGSARTNRTFCRDLQGRGGENIQAIKTGFASSNSPSSYYAYEVERSGSNTAPFITILGERHNLDWSFTSGDVIYIKFVRNTYVPQRNYPPNYKVCRVIDGLSVCVGQWFVKRRGTNACIHMDNFSYGLTN